MDPDDFSDGSDESDLDYIPPGNINTESFDTNYSPKCIFFMLPIIFLVYTRGGQHEIVCEPHG